MGGEKKIQIWGWTYLSAPRLGEDVAGLDNLGLDLGLGLVGPGQLVDLTNNKFANGALDVVLGDRHGHSHSASNNSRENGSENKNLHDNAS